MDNWDFNDVRYYILRWAVEWEGNRSFKNFFCPEEPDAPQATKENVKALEYLIDNEYLYVISEKDVCRYVERSKDKLLKCSPFMCYRKGFLDYTFKGYNIYRYYLSCQGSVCNQYNCNLCPDEDEWVYFRNADMIYPCLLELCGGIFFDQDLNNRWKLLLGTKLDIEYFGMMHVGPYETVVNAVRAKIPDEISNKYRPRSVSMINKGIYK